MAVADRDGAQGEQPGAAGETSLEGWTPFIDWSSTFPGNRGVNRQGRYELYDAPLGVRLRIEEATKSGPVLRADREWDGGGQLVPLKVWQDSKGYHLLYSSHPRTTGHPGLANNALLCYARSADGLRWERPDLGQLEWSGSRKNNIIANAPTGTPFEDPAGKVEERFKAMGQVGGMYDAETGEPVPDTVAYGRWRAQEYQGAAYTGPRVEFRHWVDGWVSPDGLHWKSVGKLGDMSSDGGSAAHYDPESGSYFAYIRVGGMGRRATGLTRTRDFWHWPRPELVLFPDPQDDPDVSFYGASYFRYPDSGLHCAFLETYHQIADCNDAQIAFSRDMIHWFRPERRAIIPLGAQGSEDSGGARPWGGLYVLPDGSWATMYRGHVTLHNYRESEPRIEMRPGVLMVASWRPHRFAAIEAAGEGRFTIPTVKRGRNELRLNFRTRSGGSIAAELISAVPSRIHPDADPIPGYSFAESDLLSGDSLDAAVSWRGKSDISSVGDTVAVRLRLFQARVYAYSV